MRSVLAPAVVRENPLLGNRAGQALDGGPCMLLLTWVEDRLRAKFLRCPAHPGKLRRRYRKGQDLSGYFGLQEELAPLLVPLVQDLRSAVLVQSVRCCARICAMCRAPFAAWNGRRSIPQSTTDRNRAVPSL